MKLYVVVMIALLINSGSCIRNLFLPRTGDININPIIAENLSNVTNFQSLLGAGRSLAYPFAAGVLLSIATLANENNWKVSDTGFSKILGVPRQEILESYGTLLDILEGDDNVTLSNMLFSLRPEFSPSEELTETLMTEVREVTWTRETWRDTYNLMVEHLSNVTNERIDKLLIPSVTQIGTPFRKSTQAVVLSSFHYINGWQYPWTDAEIGKFQGNEGIPYLKVEGSFLVAEEEEYTAVAVPLEGGMKNVVFVLPHVNISSKYFRTHPEDESEEIDVVPFPKNWKLKTLKLEVPAFNTTDVDQYGQELEQVGMNETFCTIIRDYFGRYPYYMRPMVQVNFLDFNEDYLELASATGVAVERFQSLLSLFQDPNIGNDDDERRRHSEKQQQSPDQINNENLSVTANGKMSEVAGEGEMNNILESIDSANNASVVTNESGYISLEEESTTQSPDSSDIPTLTFDRPFLWYLNDSEVGPLFFGTVEILVNLALAENSTEPGDDDEMMTTISPAGDGMDAITTTSSPVQNQTAINAYLAEIEKFYLWSCRSFVPTSGGPNNISSIVGSGADKRRVIPHYFALSFDEDDAATTNSSISQPPATSTQTSRER